MSKSLKATRQTSGERQIKETTIIVPDSVYDLLKEFDIELIDHRFESEQCSIYLIKDGEDKYSVTFRPFDNSSYANAIKQLVEDIKEDK